MTDVDDRRVEELERRVVRLEADLRALARSVSRRSDQGAVPNTLGLPAPTGPVVTTSTGGPDPRSPMPPPPTAGSRVQPPPPLSPTRVGRRFEPSEWLEIGSERALRWTGVGLVVLAVGFAVSTAISRGWIGPELQLLGAIGVSLGLVGAGLRLRPTRPGWTHALCSGGTLGLLSVVGSSLFLDQFDQTVAYGCTAAIGLAGYVLARVVPSPWVAGATLLGSITGWLVISAGDPPFVVSVVWVSVAVAVAVTLSIERSWYVVRTMAQATGAVAGLAFAIAADGPRQESAVLACSALLFGCMAFVPSMGRGTSMWRELEMQLVHFAPPWAFLVLVAALEVDGERQTGGVAMAVAAGALAAALAVFARVRPTHLVSLLMGASVTFSIGLALVLSPTATFFALAVLAAGLVVLARAFPSDWRVALQAVVLGAIALVGVIGELFTAWTTDASATNDSLHAVTIVALAAGVWLSRRPEARSVGVGVVLLATMLWLGSVLVHLPQGQALVSLSWAAVGTSVLLIGSVRKVPALGALGLGVIAVTVGKLLTVDLREVDALWRAALFFVVGIGIMRLGFLLPRLTAPETPNDPGGGTDLRPPRPDDLASVG